MRKTLDLASSLAERDAVSERPRKTQPLALERPTGDFLAAIPWEGVAPDPDELDAATFLGLL